MMRLVGALVLVGVGVLVGRGLVPEASPTLEAEPAAEGGASELVVLARVEPYGGLIGVAAGSAGTVSSVTVAEGERAEEGQVLARLDGWELRRRERVLLEQRLEDAERTLAAELEHARAQQTEAELGRRQVELDRLGVARAESEIRAAQFELEYAQAELERVEELQGRGVASPRDYNDALVSVRRLEGQLEQARLERDRLEAAAELGVAQAEAKSRTAAARLEVLEGSSPVEALRAELEVARAREEQALVRAPCGCEVLKVLTQVGEAAGGPLFYVGRTRRMTAIAEVYQTDVRRVSVGDAVTLSSPAWEEEVEGEVVEVGRLIFKSDVFGDDPSAPRNARVVQVRVDVEEDDALAGYSNLEVEARIELSSEAGR